MPSSLKAKLTKHNSPSTVSATRRTNQPTGVEVEDQRAYRLSGDWGRGGRVITCVGGRWYLNRKVIYKLKSAPSLTSSANMSFFPPVGGRFRCGGWRFEVLKYTCHFYWVSLQAYCATDCCDCFMKVWDKGTKCMQATFTPCDDLFTELLWFCLGSIKKR